MAFTTYPTAVGVAFDMQLGLIDRFRTMPIHPSAMFIGRTFLGDLGRMAISITAMALCGLSVGWRIHDGFARAAAGFGLAGAVRLRDELGGRVPLADREEHAGRAESADAVAVPRDVRVERVRAHPAHAPGVLEGHRQLEPGASSVAAATRSMFGNPHPFEDPSLFPAQHSVLLTVAWSLLLTLVAAVLCTRRMRAVAQ